MRDAVLSRHGDPEEWLTYTEAWRIDVFALRCRRGRRKTVRREDGTLDYVELEPDYRRVAYEIKVSRSDFLAEIRRPAKRRRALELAHEFYFAVPPSLVSAEEVPEECGLVYVWESGVTRTVKPAAVGSPRDFTVEEVVYLARTPLYRERHMQTRLELRHARWLLERHGLRPPGDNR